MEIPVIRIVSAGIGLKFTMLLFSSLLRTDLLEPAFSTNLNDLIGIDLLIKRRIARLSIRMPSKPAHQNLATVM